MVMTKVYVGDEVQWNGKNWLIRGLNATKGVYVTERKMSYNRAYIPLDALKRSGLEYAKAEKAKKAVKAETPKAEPKKATPKAKARQSYSKTRGLDMKSSIIQELAKSAVCSYNYNGAHASLNGTVVHVDRFGKKQDFVKARKSTVAECLVVYCENAKGDKCIIAHDNATGETSLIVMEKAA